MKKTKEELQNELAEAQRQYDQEQHRQQRLQNRKEYFETTARRQRNHRLITRGAAMESVFPEVKPLTEREFHELAEQMADAPGIPDLVHRAVIHHEAGEKEPEAG